MSDPFILYKFFNLYLESSSMRNPQYSILLPCNPTWLKRTMTKKPWAPKIVNKVATRTVVTRFPLPSAPKQETASPDTPTIDWHWEPAYHTEWKRATYEVGQTPSAEPDDGSKWHNHCLLENTNLRMHPSSLCRTLCAPLTPRYSERPQPQLSKQQWRPLPASTTVTEGIHYLSQSA